ncbi:MAG: OmpH family outer membrane protein [Bacteroidetes bacterium]|nr:OmpH family outer membrane protein [Bacteroidota bacterium]MBT5529864.1 OmpH family outer membrane protein [Cytophagia bacterium]MBT3421962.1 OmpH family outer membrane protein [Bacteroidota bacterium]MBT3800023.1 OmpH family outer membrane protein [Bacteroidota bacterium]MBT3934351.1 OmpH family outer membrane protein [Bacteroidota bacterium]
MKKISIALNIAFAAAIISLFILHFTSKTPGEKSVVTESDTAVAFDSSGQSTLRIAFVNTDTILANYDYYSDQISEIQNDKVAAEKRVMDKLKVLEEEYQKYIYKVKLGVMTEAQAEAEFSKKNEELESYRTSASNALMEKQEQISKRLYDSVFNAVARYNERSNFTYILANNSINNSLLHADKSYDLTKEILSDLNTSYDKYIESKKKK